jgi:hypothetical protein
MTITRETYRVISINGATVTSDREKAKEEYQRVYNRLAEVKLLSNVYPALWLVLEFDDGASASVRLK